MRPTMVACMTRLNYVRVCEIKVSLQLVVNIYMESQGTQITRVYNYIIVGRGI